VSWFFTFSTKFVAFPRNIKKKGKIKNIWKEVSDYNLLRVKSKWKSSYMQTLIAKPTSFNKNEFFLSFRTHTNWGFELVFWIWRSSLHQFRWPTFWFSRNLLLLFHTNYRRCGWSLSSSLFYWGTQFICLLLKVKLLKWKKSWVFVYMYEVCWKSNGIGSINVSFYLTSKFYNMLPSK